jgi:hypothetical protein
MDNVKCSPTYSQHYFRYITLLIFLAVEVLFRFITWPSWDALYDMVILGIDCYCTFSAILGTDSFIYFGIAIPLRIALFVADLDVLQPVFYKLSLNVPKILYLLLLFSAMMYFFGMITFILFSQENNPDCSACGTYFPDLQSSLVTIFEVSTFQNWGDVTRAMYKEPKLRGVFVLIYFASFGVLMNFVLFNIFTAVVVDVIIAASQTEIPEGTSQSFWNRVLMEMCIEVCEVFLNDEEQSRLRDTKLTEFQKIVVIWKAVTQDIIDIPMKFKRFVARLKGQTDSVPPSPAQRRAEEHDYLLTESHVSIQEESDTQQILNQMQEMMNMLRSMDHRISNIEKVIKHVNL